MIAVPFHLMLIGLANSVKMAKCGQICMNTLPDLVSEFFDDLFQLEQGEEVVGSEEGIDILVENDPGDLF